MRNFGKAGFRDSQPGLLVEMLFAEVWWFKRARAWRAETLSFSPVWTLKFEILWENVWSSFRCAYCNYEVKKYQSITVICRAAKSEIQIKGFSRVHVSVSLFSLSGFCFSDLAMLKLLLLILLAFYPSCRDSSSSHWVKCKLPMMMVPISYTLLLARWLIQGFYNII